MEGQANGLPLHFDLERKNFAKKVACLPIAGLIGVELLAQLACETRSPPATVPDTPPTPTGPGQNFSPEFHRVNGGGTFPGVSDASGANDPGTRRGAAHGDLDGDGLLDLFVVNMGNRGNRDGESGTSRLFISTSENANNRLRPYQEGPRATGPV